MNIAVFNRQRTLKIPPEKVKALVKEALTFEGITCEEVSVHFIGSTRMCQLHAEYFADPTLTDCISFPCDASGLLGDVFVCPSVAKTYASQHGLDPLLETTLYVIHGLLHLIGYDDIKENDRIKMRAAEERVLSHLKRRRLTL